MQGEGDLDLSARISALLIEISTDPRIDAFGHGYWQAVIRGVQGLMALRDELNDRDRLLLAFKAAAHHFRSGASTDMQENIADELEAVLINWYPMADFWTTSFEEFCAHPNFSHYRD